MRILHVLGSLNRGGAETWLVQAWRHIDRSKFQFDFAVHTTAPGAFDEEVRSLGARVIPCVPTSNPITYAIYLRRILRQFGPYDCVHSHVHHFSGFVLMLAALFGVPVRIAHSHNDNERVDRDPNLARHAYLSTMKLLIERFGTGGLAVSDVAAQSLFGREWGGDPRWRRSHLGIDLAPFAAAVDRKKVRAELDIPEDAFVIGHVGRFCEQKNHQFFVDIAEEILKEAPGALFLLVGDGPLRASIESLVERRGLTRSFRFAGPRDNVPEIMRTAMNVFLFPSLWEGLPIAVLEAQAADLPCILSDSITAESNFGLVTQLPLTESASKWARVVLEYRDKHSAGHAADMHEVSIVSAVSRLQETYDSFAAKLSL